MPYANNHGVRIHYEVEGEGGPPLVMAHGGSGDLSDWFRLGYTRALQDEFLLIMYDARGRGLSERGGEGPSNALDDAVAVLDAVGMSEAHFWGYSAGAITGFDLAVRGLDRFRSFILGGMTPSAWPEEMVKAIRISIDLFRLRLSDPDAYLERMETLVGHPLSPAEREDLLARDAMASIASQEALLDRAPLTEGQLAAIKVPCLVYCGEQDPFHTGAQESVCHIPEARFVTLPGLNHITAYARSDQIVTHVRTFLEELSDW
jgi:pimeloyl-ACP methyl ester carboxylesterase